MPRLPALLALLALGLPACAAADPGPARGCPEACDTGKSCVIGRCRAPEESPSPPDTRRVVLSPTDLAVIASGSSAPDAVPETVALGRASDGTVELLLRFNATWRDDADVVSAFVVIDPLDGALPAGSGATFEAARIVEPWQPAIVTWGRQPRFELPKLAAVVRARPGTPVRVDVTAMVRDWSKRLPDDHGLLLLVRGGDATGAPSSMGVTGGNGPRLEAYVR